MVILTLLVTKLIAGLSRISGRGGGQALPGLIADRLDPHLAGKLSRGLPHGVILVTGTNGKTTTTKLIADMLSASGERVLTNSTGSNLKRGVTSALISAADWRGHMEFSVGLFEVDEASLRQVAPELLPDHIVVLNLFRDQLDRYGELDTTAAMIGQAIAATQAHLYLNADDPLVASLSRYAAGSERVTFFGAEVGQDKPEIFDYASDSDRCPLCRTRLKFDRKMYAHIGHYECPRGDFGRPKPEVDLREISKANLAGSDFQVSIRGKRSDFNIGLPGLYNLYNALAAVSVGDGFGIDHAKLNTALSSTEAAFGRVERVEVRGHEVYLLLVKNPAGFTQVLETLLMSRARASVLIAVNDNDADGRDVSWLWDVPFEAIHGYFAQVICTGIRGADMALRLKYAGLESVVAEDVERALEQLLERTPAGGNAFILPTYTAMLEIRKLLSKKTQMQEVWK
jgi:UDP-N-acetylmuramyl tripeptide synthase